MEETVRQHCPIQNHLGPMDPCSIIAAIADNGRLGCPSVITADFYVKNMIIIIKSVMTIINCFQPYCHTNYRMSMCIKSVEL